MNLINTRITPKNRFCLKKNMYPLPRLSVLMAAILLKTALGILGSKECRICIPPEHNLEDFCVWTNKRCLNRRKMKQNKEKSVEIDE